MECISQSLFFISLLLLSLSAKFAVCQIQVFTPMLASAAVGTVEYRSMTEPIRVTNPCIDNFVEGRAIGIDVKNRKIAVQLTKLSTVTNIFKGIATDAPGRLEPEPVLTNIIYDEETNSIQRDPAVQGAGDVIELNYDHLICAVGTAARSSIVSGAKEYCTYTMLSSSPFSFRHYDLTALCLSLQVST